ncbi:MAG: FxsA family protein [Myxococcota bacterium]
MILLLLLFTVVPAIELYALLQLGAWLGALPTFLLVITTGVVGSWLAKREGVSVLMELQSELQQGLPPGERVLEGVMVFVGGLLLVTPGVFTDLFGFLLITGPTRRLLAPRVLAWLTDRFELRVQDIHMGGPAYERGEPNVRIRQPRGAAIPRQNEAETPFSNKFDDLP